MGAAWRQVTDGRAFDRVLAMVSGVRALGLEACATLGMLTEAQARRLKEAGLTAYNHNLDTSADYYSEIITTRTYQDRLDTIAHVAAAGISLCCGGILGMGESREDRVKLLHTLANLDPQPGSGAIQRLGSGRGNAAWRCRTARYFRMDSRHCCCAHFDAESDGAIVGRAPFQSPRSASAGLYGRRQCHFHRR